MLDFKPVVLIALLMSLSPTAASSQILPPLPRTFDPVSLPFATLFGEGSVQSKDEITDNPFKNPSARVSAIINAHPRFPIYVAINKAAQASSGNSEVALSDLAFPKVAGASVLIDAAFSLHEAGKDRTHAFPIYLDYALQQREATSDDGTVHNFDASMFYVGVRWQYTNENPEEPIRFTVAPAWASLQITDASVRDFRQIFNDPDLPDVYSGPSIKVALHYNDWAAEFGYVDLRGRGGRSAEGLTDGRFSIEFSAAGKLVDIGRR